MNWTELIQNLILSGLIRKCQCRYPTFWKLFWQLQSFFESIFHILKAFNSIFESILSQMKAFNSIFRHFWNPKLLQDIPPPKSWKICALPLCFRTVQRVSGQQVFEWRYQTAFAESNSRIINYCKVATRLWRATLYDITNTRLTIRNSNMYLFDNKNMCWYLNVGVFRQTSFWRFTYESYFYYLCSFREWNLFCYKKGFCFDTLLWIKRKTCVVLCFLNNWYWL